MTHSDRTNSRWLTRDEIQAHAIRALVHGDGPVDALGYLSGDGASELDKAARDLIKEAMDRDSEEAFRMTPSEQSNTETDRDLVDLRAFINDGDAELHRDDFNGFWLKPSLDGDGEIRIDFRELSAALRLLGYNRMDVWREEGSSS